MDKISYKCVQRPMLTIATMINPNENMLTSSEMKKKVTDKCQAIKIMDEDKNGRKGECSADKNDEYD